MAAAPVNVASTEGDTEMRMRKGDPFMHVKASGDIPDDTMISEMKADMRRDGLYPVFSEGHLYPRLGKEDARFVLGVVEEYDKLIEVLGVEAIKKLLA
jgi:hypothetical protein